MVTGSTSGIGLGIARALAEAGADVMLNGFGDAKEIESLRTRIAADYGVNTAFSGADISRPSAICEMVQDAKRKLGGVEILVNNAGIQHTSPVDRSPMTNGTQSSRSTCHRTFMQLKRCCPR